MGGLHLATQVKILNVLPENLVQWCDKEIEISGSIGMSQLKWEFFLGKIYVTQEF